MKLGIIGGSGLYDMEGLQNVHRKRVKTPFGDPSDEIVCGTFRGREVAFLPRHGRGHRIMPSEINHRANIFALKVLGVERVVSVSAVGSLQERMRPRDIVLPAQYFDRTKQSLGHTFFGRGLVAHVTFAEPTCGELRKMIATSARHVVRRRHRKGGPRLFVKGTYVNMEGPAFSTKAESHVYRKLGFDVIGMTSLPEAKLCREAEMCYQSIAMVTDYDCWHDTGSPVSVEMIIGHLQANTLLAKEILRELIPTIGRPRRCDCRQALATALVTDRKIIPRSTLKNLAPLIGRYITGR